MATIKAYTDIEQSRKLAEILLIESADMYYNSGDEHDICFGSGIYKEIADWICEGTPRPADIPCWSLSALLGVLPLVEFTTPQLIGTPKTLYRCMYNDDLKSHAYDNPVDACYEMILKLKEKNLL